MYINIKLIAITCGRPAVAAVDNEPVSLIYENIKSFWPVKFELNLRTNCLGLDVARTLCGEAFDQLHFLFENDCKNLLDIKNDNTVHR